MTRGNFFKSLITLMVAPKVVAEIDFSKFASNNTAMLVGMNSRNLFADLQLLTPSYFEKMVKRYGSEDYHFYLETLGTPLHYKTEFFWHENGKV